MVARVLLTVVYLTIRVGIIIDLMDGMFELQKLIKACLLTITHSPFSVIILIYSLQHVHVIVSLYVLCLSIIE